MIVSSKFFWFLTFLLLFWLKGNLTIAQTATDTTTLYRLETKDGNEYIGNILNQTPDNIQFRTQKLGTLTFLRTDIKAITAIDARRLKNGKLWFDNPQATRYLFSPNGYGLKPGEGYYQNIWVFFNQVSMGITENISVGAGLMPLFLFAGSSSPVWFLPKVSIPVIRDRLNVGAGALIGAVVGEESSGFGIAYGISTFGTRDRNVSLGLGYGYAGGDWANSPTITASGLLRTGNRGYLISENYFIGTGDGTLGLISVGGRRIIKRVGLDFGLGIPFAKDLDDFLAIPFLGFTVPFGQQKSRIPTPAGTR
jgi:hypothetical protein